MKNSSYIADSVFKMNLYYTRKQNKTKQLFFKCLNEEKDVEYFKEELVKIWGEDNRTYIEQKITELREEIHKENTKSKLEKVALIGLGSIALINETNKSFRKKKATEYTIRFTSPLYKSDKENYLKKLVPKYTNDTKPYYSNGKLIREVKPSTYNSMVYNTTLTKNAWIQTLNDAEDLGQELLYIPFHNFSCPECAMHQEKIMTREECLRILGTAEEQEGDLLHPNCKCTLAFYQNNLLRQINFQDVEEEYYIRQKVNGLTLKKEEVLSDMKIQKSLGNYDEYDKLNSQRNKINSQIRDLKSQLPTEELQKQVVAINR